LLEASVLRRVKGDEELTGMKGKWKMPKDVKTGNYLPAKSSGNQE
jgi:hypothetical protein